MFPATARHSREKGQKPNEGIVGSEIHNIQAPTKTQSFPSLQIMNDEKYIQSDLSSLPTQTNHSEIGVSQHPMLNAPPPPHAASADSILFQDHVHQQSFMPFVDASQQMNAAASSPKFPMHYETSNNNTNPFHTSTNFDHKPSSHHSQPNADSEQRYHVFPPVSSVVEGQPPQINATAPPPPAPEGWPVRDSWLETHNQWPHTVFDPSLRMAHQQDPQERPTSPSDSSLHYQATDISKKQISKNKEHPCHASSLQDASTSDISLASYIIRNFNNSAFADCRLLMTHANSRFPPTTFSVHSLLIARSPLINSLLRNGQYSYDFDGLKLLHLHLNDRFVTPSALEATIRTCYGEHVSSFSGSTTKARPPRSKAEFSVTWMCESLAFAASGLLLEMKEAVLRGLEIAGKIVNWDNLEHALSFSLDVGAQLKRGPSTPILPQSISSPADDSDSSTTNAILTPDTNQDSPRTSFGSNGDNPKDLRVGPFGVDCADSLLLRCLRFIATHFPHSWDFDPTARPLPNVDRLPSTSESRSFLAKSRLSKIQFGNLPPEVATQPSSHDSFISSILLSLPFTSLKVLVDLENRAIKQRLQSIVEEREQRRGVLLQSLVDNAPQSEAAKHDGWSEVWYKEDVENVQGEPCLIRSHLSACKDKAEPGLEQQ